MSAPDAATTSQKIVEVAKSSCSHRSRDGHSSDSFQFVNLTNKSKLDGSSRARIRSRATWSSYNAVKAVALDKSDQRTQMGRFRLQPKALRRQSQADSTYPLNFLGWKTGLPVPQSKDLGSDAQPWSGPILGPISLNPANAAADPFDVLPVPTNSRESILLQHCELRFNFISKLHWRYIISISSSFVSFISFFITSVLPQVF